MTADSPGTLIPRLISQRLKFYEVDQINDLIRGGTDVYVAMFEFEHAHQAPRIKSVGEWTEDATEITIAFSEKVLPDKRIGVDDEVTIYYLKPFNPA